ncbi:MAG: hypothetical protein Kow00104_01400 [Rhodothalassiaceae bacterium]
MRRHNALRGREILRATLIGLALGASQALAQETKPFRLDAALDTPDWLTLSGEHRTRYSHLSNQFRPGLDENDKSLSFRTLLKAEAKFGNVSFVGEMQDSRAYFTDENSGVSTIIVDTFELLQGYVNLRLDDVVQKGATLDLTGGRQTIDIGSRRLIARNRHRDAIQAFTGLHAHWKGADKSELRLFYVLPVTTLPSDRESLLENKTKFNEEDFDLRLWGVFYKRPDLLLGAAGEFYIYGLNEDDDPNERQTRNRELYTPGFRLIRSPKVGEWDFDIENTLQFGTRRATTAVTDTTDLDVFAHFHHFEIGYTWRAPWSPRLDFEFDFASGEPSTTDDEANRFDSLFGPRRSEFGPTGIFGILGRENIVSPGLRISAKPGARTDGFISWRANWLDEKTDTFARSGVRDATGQSGSFGGHQIEGRVRHWLVPGNVRLEVGAAWFIEGDFLRNAPAASGNGDPIFVYTDIAFTF